MLQIFKLQVLQAVCYVATNLCFVKETVLSSICYRFLVQIHLNIFHFSTASDSVNLHVLVLFCCILSVHHMLIYNFPQSCRILVLFISYSDELFLDMKLIDWNNKNIWRILFRCIECIWGTMNIYFSFYPMNSK